MRTRKTQYAWMSLGGLICLFGLVLVCKLRDSNRAVAQPELPPPSLKKEPAPSLFTLPPTVPAQQAKQSEKVLSSKKAEKPKEQSQKATSSGLKATLEMPLPTNESVVLPASFGPNTPTSAQTQSIPKDAASLAPAAPPPPASPALPAAALTPTTLADSSPPKKSSGDKKNPINANYGDKNDPINTNWNAPALVMPASGAETADHDSAKTQPGEPPLAPAPGPIQLYHVHSKETLYDIARRTLGSSNRWSDLHKLNPMLKPDEPLRPGTTVRLPADACVQAEDTDPVKPLPLLRPKPPTPKAKVLPLTGTYQCSLDDKGRLTLPRALRDQLGEGDTILLSPGPDKCLWLTNQPHLERLDERLDQAQVDEADVRVFKRLYFAQTEKLTISNDGRVTIPERLSQFAGLHQEVVLVGIDDHFEIWDAVRWRSYTQQKSAGHAALSEPE